MSDVPVKDILFIRKYPRGFSSENHLKRQFQSILSDKGTTTHYRGHNITFLFLGCGKIQKRLPPSIIEKLNSGKITDIIDIGGGGALDPALQKGDIVLSTNDLPVDSLIPFNVRRRQAVGKILENIAREQSCGYYERNILTSDEIIASNKRRISLYHQTQCSVVQMEHGWFLRNLQKNLDPLSFNRLYVTHIEIISDTLTCDDILLSFLELLNAMKYCFLNNHHYIGKVKSRFLKRWLSEKNVKDNT